MNESDLLKLINMQIDGEISIDEKESLEHVLNSDKKTRQKYENMQQTVAALDRVPLIDPPSSLADDIWERIDPHRYQKSVPIRQKFNTLIIEFIRPRRQMAVAFAAGLLIGAFCVGLFTQYESYSFSDLSGSIGAEQTRNVQHFTLQSADVTGIFRLEQLQTSIICQVEINTRQPFDLIFEFDSPDYHLAEFKTKSANPVYIQTTPGGIRISAKTGAEVKLFIDADDTSRDKLAIQIISDDNHLRETILFQ
jgi:hypothetical protein